MIIDKIFNQLLQIKIHNHGSPIYRKIFHGMRSSRKEENKTQVHTSLKGVY
jgi:hypothetical protein